MKDKFTRDPEKLTVVQNAAHMRREVSSVEYKDKMSRPKFVRLCLCSDCSKRRIAVAAHNKSS